MERILQGSMRALLMAFDMSQEETISQIFMKKLQGLVNSNFLCPNFEKFEFRDLLCLHEHLLDSLPNFQDDSKLIRSLHSFCFGVDSLTTSNPSRIQLIQQIFRSLALPLDHYHGPISALENIAHQYRYNPSSSSESSNDLRHMWTWLSFMFDLIESFDQSNSHLLCYDAQIKLDIICWISNVLLVTIVSHRIHGLKYSIDEVCREKINFFLRPHLPFDLRADHITDTIASRSSASNRLRFSTLINYLANHYETMSYVQSHEDEILFQIEIIAAETIYDKSIYQLTRLLAVNHFVCFNSKLFLPVHAIQQFIASLFCEARCNKDEVLLAAFRYIEELKNVLLSNAQKLEFFMHVMFGSITAAIVSHTGDAESRQCVVNLFLRILIMLGVDSKELFVHALLYGGHLLRNISKDETLLQYWLPSLILNEYLQKRSFGQSQSNMKEFLEEVAVSHPIVVWITVTRLDATWYCPTIDRISIDALSLVLKNSDNFFFDQDQSIHTTKMILKSISTILFDGSKLSNKRNNQQSFNKALQSSQFVPDVFDIKKLFTIIKSVYGVSEIFPSEMQKETFKKNPESTQAQLLTIIHRTCTRDDITSSGLSSFHMTSYLVNSIACSAYVQLSKICRSLVDNTNYLEPLLPFQRTSTPVWHDKGKALASNLLILSDFELLSLSAIDIQSQFTCIERQSAVKIDIYFSNIISSIQTQWINSSTDNLLNFPAVNLSGITFSLIHCIYSSVDLIEVTSLSKGFTDLSRNNWDKLVDQSLISIIVKFRDYLIKSAISSTFLFHLEKFLKALLFQNQYCCEQHFAYLVAVNGMIKNLLSIDEKCHLMYQISMNQHIQGLLLHASSYFLYLGDEDKITGYSYFAMIQCLLLNIIIEFLMEINPYPQIHKLNLLSQVLPLSSWLQMTSLISNTAVASTNMTLYITPIIEAMHPSEVLTASILTFSNPPASPSIDQSFNHYLIIDQSISYLAYSQESQSHDIIVSLTRNHLAKMKYDPPVNDLKYQSSELPSGIVISSLGTLLNGIRRKYSFLQSMEYDAAAFLAWDDIIDADYFFVSATIESFYLREIYSPDTMYSMIKEIIVLLLQTRRFLMQKEIKFYIDLLIRVAKCYILALLQSPEVVKVSSLSDIPAFWIIGQLAAIIQESCDPGCKANVASWMCGIINGLPLPLLSETWRVNQIKILNAHRTHFNSSYLENIYDILKFMAECNFDTKNEKDELNTSGVHSTLTLCLCSVVSVALGNQTCEHPNFSIVPHIFQYLQMGVREHIFRLRLEQSCRRFHESYLTLKNVLLSNLLLSKDLQFQDIQRYNHISQIQELPSVTKKRSRNQGTLSNDIIKSSATLFSQSSRQITCVPEEAVRSRETNQFQAFTDIINIPDTNRDVYEGSDQILSFRSDLGKDKAIAVDMMLNSVNYIPNCHGEEDVLPTIQSYSVTKLELESVKNSLGVESIVSHIAADIDGCSNLMGESFSLIQSSQVHHNLEDHLMSVPLPPENSRHVDQWSIDGASDFMKFGATF